MSAQQPMDLAQACKLLGINKRAGRAARFNALARYVRLDTTGNKPEIKRQAVEAMKIVLYEQGWQEPHIADIQPVLERAIDQFWAIFHKSAEPACPCSQLTTRCPNLLAIPAQSTRY